MRRKIVAGNWKMNKTPAEAKVLAKEIAEALGMEEATSRSKLQRARIRLQELMKGIR